MDVLRRDNLKLGGFAGLREHRLVMDPKAFGPHAAKETWPGIGNFVYLADARFNPKGATGMHGHKEIDVISVMVAGRIAHEGSLEHGKELTGRQVQVQRAGGEGFMHNEVNPDATKNRMIQMWVLPESYGEPAGYKIYNPAWGTRTRIYGGAPGQQNTYAAGTTIEVSLLKAGERLNLDKPALVYLCEGSGEANGQTVGDGDLLRGDQLSYKAETETQLITIQAA